MLNSLVSFARKFVAAHDDRTQVFYAADVVLFAGRRTHVLLIERGWDPHKGKLALPGGHVDAHEGSLKAARREAVEETGLDLTDVPLDLVGVYDAPGRDPRGRYVSVAYTATLPTMPQVLPGDDAAAAAWVPLGQALTYAHRGQLAFDHSEILAAAAKVARLG